MSRFEYPRLNRSEILSFLVDSQISGNVSAHDLANPTPDFVADLYTQLLIYLDSFPGKLLVFGPSFHGTPGFSKFGICRLDSYNLDLSVDIIILRFFLGTSTLSVKGATVVRLLYVFG